MASVRKRLQPLVAMARAHDARVLIDTSRRHLCLVVVTCDGHRHSLTMARTPSDWRGDLNVVARLRRVLSGA